MRICHGHDLRSGAIDKLRYCSLAFILFYVFAYAVAYSSTRFVEVRVEGVPEPLLSTLHSALGIMQESKKGDINEKHLRTLHRRAEGQIKTALQAFGYYKSEVKGNLQREKDRWIARYAVSVGPPLVYQDIQTEVTGAGGQEPGIQKLILNFPIKTGHVVDHGVYESTKRTWLRTAIDLGYLDARLSRREIRVDLERYRADLALILDTGPLFHFGSFNLIQDEFDENFLRRYIQIEPGQRYSAAKLIALETAFRDSGYFLEATVQPRIKDAVDHRVPVDIILEPLKPSSYVFGLGYGTDTGARGKAGWERRRVNRRGHRFGADLTLSETSKALSARYMIPIRNPQEDRFSVFAKYLNDNPDSSDSELGKIGVSRSTVHGNTHWEYGLSFQRETFTVAEQTDTVDFLTPVISLSRVTSDDRLFPKRGLRTDIGMILAYDGILSDVSFAQIHLRAKLIRSLGKRGRLLLRGEAGITSASDVTVLPASIRFFTGGDQTVRGFGYQELGPMDASGEVIGGRYLLIGSVEYEYRIKPDWSVALFLDSGNAFDDFDEPLEQGAGLGVRWHSPVGPVRLDLANALTKSGHPWRVHFSIGPDL